MTGIHCDPSMCAEQGKGQEGADLCWPLRPGGPVHTQAHLTFPRAPREEAVFPSDSVRLRDLPVTQLLGGPDLAPPPKPKLQGLEMSLGNLSGKVSSVRDATFLPACGPTITLLCPFMNSQLREGSPLAPSWLRAARGRLALRHPDSC